MQNRFFLIIIFSLFEISFANAQFVQAYEDFRKYFYVFENGTPHQLESRPVKDYAVSGESVVYVDNATNLQGYYHGEKFDLGEGNNLKFNSSRKLITYQRDQVLYVFENGKSRKLTSFLKEYVLEDEIVIFKEDNLDILRACYNGQVYDLEYTLVSKLGDYKVGDNSVAYINGSHYLKVFDNGEILELEQWEPRDFVCGRNMVAYVDGSTQNLKLYINGKILKLENFPPVSMQIGDSVFAYVSDENAFKVYTNGKLLKVESYVPDYYKVKDNICAFFTENKLQIIWRGTRYMLENFNPQSYQINGDFIAWLDNAGRLKMFNNGKILSVTSEVVTSYTLNGDVLKYIASDGYPHIFYNGKNF